MAQVFMRQAAIPKPRAAVVPAKACRICPLREVKLLE